MLPGRRRITNHARYVACWRESSWTNSSWRCGIKRPRMGEGFKWSGHSKPQGQGDADLQEVGEGVSHVVSGWSTFQAERIATSGALRRYMLGCSGNSCEAGVLDQRECGRSGSWRERGPAGRASQVTVEMAVTLKWEPWRGWSGGAPPWSDLGLGRWRWLRVQAGQSGAVHGGRDNPGGRWWLLKPGRLQEREGVAFG